MAHTPIHDCLKALQCLYLEVDSSIADDVKAKVLAALDWQKQQSYSKEDLISFHNWVTGHAFDENARAGRSHAIEEFYYMWLNRTSPDKTVKP